MFKGGKRSNCEKSMLTSVETFKSRKTAQRVGAQQSLCTFFAQGMMQRTLKKKIGYR